MKWIAPLALVAFALLFLPPLVLDGERLLDDSVTLPLGALLKLGFQLAAAFGAFACARSFAADDPTRRAFTELALGSAAFAGGQLVLARWQVLAREMAPFPSPADALLMPGTLLIALGLIDFARAYAGSGMSLGSARRALISAAIAVAIIAPTIAWLLYDVVNAPTPLATRLVAAAYPVLDVGLVVPALVLIDQTRHLRGGVLWSGWVLLLAGALSMAVGDIAFAWFEVLGLDALDPILDFAFGAAYVLWAWGVFAHRRALASD